MENMVVVVFDSESKAYEGTNALAQLDRDGSITVHAGCVIKKNAEGKTVVLKTVDDLSPRYPGRDGDWKPYRASRRPLRRHRRRNSGYAGGCNQ